MEIQVQDIIASIRKDGIEAANAEAQQILADANRDADEIIRKAKNEAAAKLAEAEQKISAMKAGAAENVQQAQRDAVLSFRRAIEAEYRKILAASVRKAMDGDALAALIQAVLTDKDPADYTVETATVTDALKSMLAEEIQNGLEIRISPTVRSGFRLAQKDGSGYFDCSDQEVAAMLQPFFSSLNF